MNPRTHPNPLRNLAIVVPVWNEEFMLPAKLKDLDRINPGMVIFTEGCFDASFPANSNDRSREMLEVFKKTTKFQVEIIDAVRQSRLKSILAMYQSGYRIKRSLMIFERLVGLINSTYRSNQASTLNIACTMAKRRGMSHVFINDVDEYLSNSVLKTIRDAGLRDKSVLFQEIKTRGLPPQWLNREYPGKLKNWNGIYPLTDDFFLIPTREPRFFSSSLRSSSPVEEEGYELQEPIFHIKFLDSERTALSYAVGGRKPPDFGTLETVPLPEEYANEISQILNHLSPR